MHIKLIFCFFLVTCLMTSAHGQEALAPVSTMDLPHATTEATKSELKAVAIAKVKQLIVKGVIDQSWQSDVVLTSLTLEKRKHHDIERWVIRFENHDREKNPAKKKLYVFLKLSGDYLSADFNGK